MGTLISFSIFFGFYAEAQDIRIRLLKKLDKFQLAAQQLKIYKDENLVWQNKSPFKRNKFIFQKKFENNKWIWSLTSDEQVVVISSKNLKIKGDFVELNNRWALPDEVKFFGSENKMDVVIDLPLEEYLKGVLPKEMPLNWPLESLKAQAVASRSYVLSLLNERAQWHFDVDASVNDQVFHWVRNMEDKIPKYKKLESAIRLTKGQVLLYNDNQIYRAFFHAESAGQTELAKYVWGKESKQPSQSVKTSYKYSPNRKWQKIWSTKELNVALNNYNLKDIQVHEKSPSGRVVSLKLIGENIQIISANEFRQKLGFSNLKSTWFEIEKNDSGFLFVGHGFGHGVGLCQWGAKYLANDKSFKYKDILSHFYPGTYLGFKNGFVANENFGGKLKSSEPTLLLSSFSGN